MNGMVHYGIAKFSECYSTEVAFLFQKGTADIATAVIHIEVD